MENTSFLSELTYPALLWRIVGAVRRQAKVATTSRDGRCWGMVRVEMKPLSKIADNWLGGLSGHQSFGDEEGDVCKHQYILKLDPKTDDTRVFEQIMDGEAAQVDITIDGTSFLRIEIYVSSSSMVDWAQRDCALEGALEVQRCFEPQLGDRVYFNPYIDEKVLPLEQVYRTHEAPAIAES